MIKVITHKDCLTTRSQRSKEKLQRPNSPKQGRGDRHSSPHQRMKCNCLNIIEKKDSLDGFSKKDQLNGSKM